MSLIHDLTNLGKCGQANFSGTSNDFCVLDVKRIKKVLRAPYGFKFASDFELTLPNLLTLEQEGKIIPLYTLVNTAFATAENGVETFGGGKKKSIEKMPIEITGKLINGIQGYQNTLSLEKAQLHSFFLIDTDNTIFGFKGKDGLFGGINSEYFEVMPYSGSGDESAGYMVGFQLDRTQFDNGLVGILNADYDFEIDDVKGVTNLIITAVAPVVGAETLSITAKRKEDNVAQLGLDTTELKVTVAGAVVGGATLTEVGEGVYTVGGLTALTLGQIVTVQTKGGSTTVANLDGTLLKSNLLATVTVSA
jgi:hypothetical protein